MRVDDLDYDLPEDLIAQEPAPRREDARLLGLDRRTGSVAHHGVRDLPDLVRPGDLLVVNDTRVIPARLIARRDTGGRVEVLLLGPADAGDHPGQSQAMTKAGGTLIAGEILRLGDDDALRLVAGGSGRWTVEPHGADMRRLLERHGRMPLPPYIRRDDDDPRAAGDRERYQTTFAAHDGAIAAPTAGLHLTPALFEALRARRVDVARLTLHVGLGTFEPVRVDDLDDHPMHEEVFEIPAETADAVRRARRAGGRVVAVGTTSVRALEAAAAASPDGLPTAVSTRTRLLIQPGYRFRVVDALLTNFHLPRSTLMALVAAFAGREAVLRAYREAARERYRFYSYGDACWIA